MKNASIGAILLAAGRSSRMGQHKLLLPLGGRPLVAYSVEAASASSADPVLVILGYQAAEVEAALPAGRYSVCTNPKFASGMASSLCLGIEAFSTLSAAGRLVAGAIILLADQPLISTSQINRLLLTARATPDAIVAAAYAGHRSTPVYFPRHLFDELLQITGDEGGRSVIANHLDLVKLLHIVEPEVGLDVDLGEEYEELRANWGRYSTYLG
jgi:molybdenum cofactor cytidylyltransferase